MNHKILAIIFTTLFFSTSLPLNAKPNEYLNKGKGETLLVNGKAHFFSDDSYVYVDEGNGRYSRYKWAWKDKSASTCKNCSTLDSMKLGAGDIKRIKLAYLKQQARQQQARQQQARQQQARQQQARQQQARQQQARQQQARQQQARQQQARQQQARQQQARQQQARQYQVQPIARTLNCPTKPLTACSPSEASITATAMCGAAMGSCEYIQKDMSTKEHYVADQACNALINKMNRQETSIDSILLTGLGTVIDEASSEANKKSDNWFERIALGILNIGFKATVFGQCHSAAVQSCSAEYSRWRNSCQ